MNFYPVYPIVCGLAIIAVLLPLPWHLKARNTGTLLYIAWTLIGNIMFMVNTTVWHRNVINHAPVWCDISVKLNIGLSVGLTASSLCINRRLYNIATIKSVSISAKHKRNQAIIDLLLGVGLPCLVMVLSYIVQGQRYNLVEDVGCWPNVYNSLLSYALVWMWPIVISCASFIYCALSIRAFLKTRQQFNQILSNSHSGVNMSRYFRLMALASTEMVFSLPFAIFFFVNNLRNGVQPWVSWDDLKYRFSDIQLWPSILVEASGNGVIGFYIMLWAVPAGGFIFFIYFGLGGETFADYKRIFWGLVAPLGLKPRPAKTQPTYQGRTITSSVGATEPQAHTQVLSLPDLDDTLEKSSVDDDLEAGKPKSRQ